MAYPVIPESKSVGNLRTPPAADSMTVTKQNKGVKIDNSFKPYISRTYPTAKWVGKNGQPCFTVTASTTGSPGPNVDFINGSKRTRAALALLGTGIEVSNTNFSLLRYTCKRETKNTFIHHTCQCVDGVIDPPNDGFFGAVMVGDFPYDNEDIGASKSPYYLAFENSFHPTVGYSPSILVYPTSMVNADVSKMVSPYILWFNGVRVLRQDTIENNYPRFGILDLRTARHSKGTRRVWVKEIREYADTREDAVLPGDKCTKVIRPNGVGYNNGASYREIGLSSGSVGLDWVDHFNVADGGSLVVEYTGLMSGNPSATKWPVPDAQRANQMKRVKLDTLTTNVCYVPNRNIGTGQSTEIWSSSSDACVFDIKANNSIIEIHIPNVLFISGLRASIQHLYLCNIRGVNNKIFIHIGQGLTFFGGETADNKVFWYAGLSANDTNEIIFVKDGSDKHNAFTFEGNMPVDCRALYPISKLKNSQSNRATGCWWDPDNRLVTEGAAGWNGGAYSSVIAPF